MRLRLNKIKEIIKEMNCDSYIVLDNNDIRYFSGLVSSNIALLITLNNSYVFSDARYKFVIEGQNIFEPICVSKPIIECLKEKVIEIELKNTLIDPMHINYKNYTLLSESVNLVNKSDITKKLRIIKDEAELDNIIKAQHIAEKAFNEVIKTIKYGDTTKQIAALLDYKMNLYGSEESSFPTIVVNEEESANCHGVPSNKKISKGDLLLFDFGATYNGYRSDMTRTVAISEISDEKKKIYDIVYNAHIFAAKELKPGIMCKDIDAVARNYISKCGYGEYFMHSLGHGVGLDVHEHPSLNTKCEEVLREGMVVTVEPGVYLKNKFGIRIEDTYILTKNGCKSIANIEKSIIII